MPWFILRRLGAGVVLVFVISSVAYALIFSSAGGNAARNILGESATADQVAAKAAELGLDKPLWQQYTTWLAGAVHGDFGRSWFTSERISEMVANRIPVTLSMVIGAVLVTALLSALLGVTAAVRGGVVDRALQFVSVLGFALPNYWLALVLVLAFAITWPLFPATGFVPLDDDPGQWARSLVLPVTALAVGGIASAAQQFRGAVIDVLDLDYVRTLRAHGIGGRSVLIRHVMRNAASPALTVLSLQFIGLLGGAVVIEKVFGVPGLGTLTVNSAFQGDIPATMGVVVVMVLMVVVVNLLIDIAGGWINPKARVR
jgi:peptide/nickel transport system permease protein